MPVVYLSSCSGAHKGAAVEKGHLMENKIDRRAFIGTAAVAGVLAGGMAAGSAQATEASPDGSAAATDEGQSADADDVMRYQTDDVTKAVWPATEPVEIMGAGQGEVAFVGEPIDAAQIVETHDVDVVVAGFGHAGGAAGLACAEAGLKTVVVEKASVGNYQSATIGATGGKIMDYWGMKFDKQEYMADAARESSFQGNLELYSHWFDTNPEAVDWYMAHLPSQDPADYELNFNLGVDIEPTFDQYVQMALSKSWNTTIHIPYGPSELRDIVEQGILDAGGEIRYNTPACQLVKDDSGAVTGLIVKNEDGEYEQYNAAKGVILTTGGYEFNPEMIRQRCRPRNVPQTWLTFTTGNTGDGQLMGLAAGAAEDDYPQACMLDPTQLMSCMRVNALGKRFMPEFEPYCHIALGIQAQPGAYCYYIVDSKIDEKIDYIWTAGTAPTAEYGTKETWAASCKSDNALVADTWEELAELMGVPVDAFVETMNQWNEMAANGEDTQYGMPGNMLMPLDTPPFYATKEYACGLCTVGGLLVDTNNRVLDKSNNPIPGLFAAGLTSGGMYYNTYPHNLNCISHSHNVTSAYNMANFLSGDALKA